MPVRHPTQGLLEAVRERLKGANSDEVLIAVYNEQVEFACFHNGLVWQVSSVWVPVAFGGLVLDFGETGGGVDEMRL